MPKYTSDAYLKEDFRLFHIDSPLKEEINYHYHDFHKVFIFLKGEGEYWIEEKKYELLPGDVVLIPAGTLHKPVIEPGKDYERIIIYISNDFFFSNDEIKAFFECFEYAINNESFLIRAESKSLPEITGGISNLKNDSKINREEYGSLMLRKLHIIEFLVQINRALHSNEVFFSNASNTNQIIRQITDYIDANIKNDISIDDIASDLYLNRSYIMHLFKKETGTTIGKYITDKRLFEVSQLIKKGVPKGEASLMCGFNNYKAYHYAFSKAEQKNKFSEE